MPKNLKDPLNQSYLDSYLPSGDSLSIKQLAKVGGWSSQHLIDHFKSKKLFGFTTNGKATLGKEIRYTYSIPRRLAHVFLAKVTNHSYKDVLDHICNAIHYLPDEMILHIQQYCADRLRKKNKS